jgi:hypothetical protein
MDVRQLLIIFVTLTIAAVFLYLWRRRDSGQEPG